MILINFWLSSVTNLIAKNCDKMKIAIKSNYLIIIFHVSKVQQIKFCTKIKVLKFYIDFWETKYPENLENLIYIYYFAFRIIYELMYASSNGFCKALSTLMMFFSIDPLETEIVLQCWSVSYTLNWLYTFTHWYLVYPLRKINY